MKDSGFSLKALLMGLVGVLVISGFANINDFHAGTGTMMISMHLAVAPFFLIIILAFFWNGIFSKVIPGLVFSSRELTVIMVMMLVAGFPPVSSLFRCFSRMLMMPWFHLKDRPEWITYGILDYIPGKLLPQPVPHIESGAALMDDTVYRSYFSGMALGNENIGLKAVPWGAWMGSMMYWGPMFVIFSVLIMSLSLVVHRQWAHHEQLSYPLAQVASSFTSRAEGKGISDLFRNRLFWWGFVPIFLLYTLGYLNRWYPQYVPSIDDVFPNLKGYSVQLANVLPGIQRGAYWWRLGFQTIYFSVLGLAYFVASEISLTMGLSSILLVIVSLFYFTTTGMPMGESQIDTMRAGSYIGYAFILFYAGRIYYKSLIKKALWVDREITHDDSSGVLGMRLFLVSLVGFCIMMVIMGMDWFVASIFTTTLVITFLVFTRIICETGIPFLQTGYAPTTGIVLLTLFGPAAVGPASVVIVLLMSVVLSQDMRENLMPFVSTSLRISDYKQMNIKRIFSVIFVAVLIALTVGFIAKIWADYNYGATSVDAFSYRNVPIMALDESVRLISSVQDMGLYEESVAARGFEKLKLARISSDRGPFLIAGLFAVILFAFLRFRFTKFPLHPVLFLVWGTYPVIGAWSSFLVGWGIKTLVVRFGGGKVYQNMKPLFIGLISAELFFAGTAIVIGIIYYFSTGRPPDAIYRILPG